MACAAALQRRHFRLRAPLGPAWPNRRRTGRSTNSQARRLRYEDDGSSGGGFICSVSRHILGERPVTFLNAMRNRFSLA